MALADPQISPSTEFALIAGATIPLDLIKRLNRHGQTMSNIEVLRLGGEKNIGIDAVREVKDFLAKKPVSNLGAKFVFIKPAEQLSRPAQNALLKVLEEPPAYASFVLVTRNPYQLLETIRSRCFIVTLIDEDRMSTIELDSVTEIWSKIIDEWAQCHSISDRLIVSDKVIPSKLSLASLLEVGIIRARYKLQNQPTINNLFNIRLLLHAYTLARQNTNPKLVLDYVSKNIKLAELN